MVPYDKERKRRRNPFPHWRGSWFPFIYLFVPIREKRLPCSGSVTLLLRETGLFNFSFARSPFLPADQISFRYPSSPSPCRLRGTAFEYSFAYRFISSRSFFSPEVFTSSCGFSGFCRRFFGECEVLFLRRMKRKRNGKIFGCRLSFLGFRLDCSRLASVGGLFSRLKGICAYTILDWLCFCCLIR